MQSLIRKLTQDWKTAAVPAFAAYAVASIMERKVAGKDANNIKANAIARLKKACMEVSWDIAYNEWKDSVPAEAKDEAEWVTAMNTPESKRLRELTKLQQRWRNSDAMNEVRSKLCAIRIVPKELCELRLPTAAREARSRAQKQQLTGKLTTAKNFSL